MLTRGVIFINFFFLRSTCTLRKILNLIALLFPILKIKSNLHKVAALRLSVEEFASSISASLIARADNIAPFKDMPQWWRFVGDI